MYTEQNIKNILYIKRKLYAEQNTNFIHVKINNLKNKISYKPNINDRGEFKQRQMYNWHLYPAFTV